MDLKKGLSFVAFGFLFVLVNLNLSLNGRTVNVTPDWLGWILLFLAFDKLGGYVENRKYLKRLSLVLILLSAVVWALGIAWAEQERGVLRTAVTVLSAVYMFLLFGVLEQIARDYGSAREDTLRVLKILTPALYIAFVLAAVLTALFDSASLAGLTLFLGFAALAAAVVTMAVLFRLRREIGDKVDETSERKDA